MPIPQSTRTKQIKVDLTISEIASLRIAIDDCITKHIDKESNMGRRKKIVKTVRGSHLHTLIRLYIRMGNLQHSDPENHNLDTLPGWLIGQVEIIDNKEA